MRLESGTHLGPYEIVAPLGAGGMGEVYRARDTRLDRTVAIKVLPAQLADNPERRQRFEREAKAISALNHPHICALYDVGHQDGTDFLVMEYVEGETLAVRLEKGALPLEQLLRVGVEVADALSKAHRQGVAHRDLKPANIMLTKSGVKLLDFGLAKALPKASPTESVTAMATSSKPLTAEGTLIGTLEYMAPEQLEGKDADARADIFALGAVLYETATGKRAFEGKSQASVIAAILEKDPPSIATLQPMAPPSLGRVVQTCLAKDPDDRWQTAHDVGLELKWIAVEVDSPRQELYGGLKPPLQRVLPWALAAAILAAVILAFVATRRPVQPNQEGVIRFSVSPPENTTFSEFSLSPDGRRLAFVGTIAGTKRQLWVRWLDSLTPELLPSTEGASWPFWSPDGRYLGFYADSKLKKVEVSGGSPQTLCDAAGVGATWSREGVIVFTNQSHLYGVPESGGAPALVAAPDLARHETAVLLPQFLPDGRHFLFFAALGTLGGRVEVGSLDSKERELLPTVSTNAQYAPPGYLLYLREGTLMAGRFDAKRLRLTGEAAPIAENVGSILGPGYSQFSVSPSGVLAYQTSTGRGTSQMIWVDRKGAKLGTVAQAGFYTNPALSPDGTKLAVALLDPKINTRDIWVYDLKRGMGSRLTFNPADDFNPVWSPDGSRIMFTSLRRGQRDIYWKPTNGLGITESVFESKDQAKSLDDWSPEGRYAIYDTTAVPASLWTLPLFGERTPFAFVQGSFHAASAQFSPNGRYVAYASEETGQSEVYVQTFPQHQGKWQVSTSGGTEPMWRRDGKELFYLGLDDKVMAAEVKTDSAQFEADIPKPLFEIQLIYGSWRNRYVVSPDGQRFLMIVPAGEAKPSPITVVVNWPALLKKQ